MKNTYPLSCVGPYSNTMNKTTLLSFLKHLAEHLYDQNKEKW